MVGLTLKRMPPRRHVAMDCWCGCSEAEHRGRWAQGFEISHFPLMLGPDLDREWIIGCEKCDKRFQELTTVALREMTVAASAADRLRLTQELSRALAEIGIAWSADDVLQ